VGEEAGQIEWAQRLIFALNDCEQTFYRSH
jgi:hypothetical protein